MVERLEKALCRHVLTGELERARRLVAEESPTCSSSLAQTQLCQSLNGRRNAPGCASIHRQMRGLSPVTPSARHAPAGVAAVTLPMRSRLPTTTARMSLRTSHLLVIETSTWHISGLATRAVTPSSRRASVHLTAECRGEAGCTRCRCCTVRSRRLRHRPDASPRGWPTREAQATGLPSGQRRGPPALVSLECAFPCSSRGRAAPPPSGKTRKRLSNVSHPASPPYLPFVSLCARNK